MTANTISRPAARPEPFAGTPRCGGQLVAGRLSGWYIRRARPAVCSAPQPSQPEAAGVPATERAPR